MAHISHFTFELPAVKRVDQLDATMRLVPFLPTASVTSASGVCPLIGSTSFEDVPNHLRSSTMSGPALRKQSFVPAVPPPAGSTTPWDSQTRPSVPDFSAYIDQAKTLCPHLVADTTPPHPPAAHVDAYSTAAQLLRVSRLQAEWEDRQLAAYQEQISGEYAALTSTHSLDNQRDIHQHLLSHFQALIADGAEGSLAAHVRQLAASPRAALHGLDIDQQASVLYLIYREALHCLL